VAKGNRDGDTRAGAANESEGTKGGGFRRDYCCRAGTTVLGAALHWAGQWGWEVQDEEGKVAARSGKINRRVSGGGRDGRQAGAAPPTNQPQWTVSGGGPCSLPPVVGPSCRVRMSWTRRVR
jgi:hypothetical protein